jgi:WD40 repeat protein
MGPEPVAILQESVAAVSLAFHPNGTLIAIGGYDGTLRLADLQLAVVKAAWQGHQGFVSDIRFAPDGRSMATGGQDGKLKVWNTSDLTLAALPVQEQTSKTTINATGFSDDGRCVAAGGYGQDILVWDLVRNKSMQLLGANQVSFGVDFAAGAGSLAGPSEGCGERLHSISADGELLTWNIGADAEYVTLTGHTNRVEAVVVDPQQKWFATADDNGEILIWKSTWASGELPQPNRRQVHQAVIYDLAASPDGKYLATASADGTAKVLETGSWHEVAATAAVTVSENTTATVRAVAFNPDITHGLMLATGQSNGVVSVWEATTGRLLKRWQVHHGADPQVNAILFSADGMLMLTAGFDGYAYVWHVQQERVLHKFDHGEGNGAYAAAFSPDNRSILVGDGQGRLHVWSLATGEKTVKSAHQGSIAALEFSPDTRYFATTSLDRNVVLWDSAMVSPVRVWRTPNDAVTDARFVNINGMPALVTTNWDSEVRVYLLQVGDVLTLAGERLTGVRTLTQSECQQYLNSSDCPS